jgi:phosphatidylserine/phosphatidylglycerophosphate/cardiolipin synthase-like enzyme
MHQATDGRISTHCTVSKSICFLLALAIYAPLSFTGVCHAAERSHHARVTLLQDQNYYETFIRGIRTARKEITGCFFIFKVAEKRNNLPMGVIRELIAAHKRGVAVTITLEQAAPDKGDVSEQNRKAAKLLSEAGIKIRFDWPKTTTHVKAMVIDNRYVYIGSHNLTQSALKYNNELSVMIDSPELAAETSAYLQAIESF